MNGHITVLLAEDHGVLREILAGWLRQTSDIAVVASVADADQALAQAIALRPDVAVLDIEMPGIDIFAAVQMMRTKCPKTRVVFLSAFHSDRFIDMALGVRASGYIVKLEPPTAVLEAIRAAAAGGTYFSRDIAARIIVDRDGMRLAHQGHSRASSLTPREVEVLRYIADGLSNKGIAHAAGISEKTVGRHIENIMAKLDLHGRVALARFAVQEGLATP